MLGCVLIVAANLPMRGPIGGRRSSVHRLVSHSGIFADCLGRPFLPLGRLRQAGGHGRRPPGRRDNGLVAPRARAARCAGSRWRFT
jgi:hypothetical protein